MSKFLKIFVIFGYLLKVISSQVSPPQVVFSWSKLDYQWPSQAMRDLKISNGEFIPENNILKNIKISGNRIFTSIPRHFEGIPVTLGYLTTNNLPSQKSGPSSSGLIGRELTPYPNWPAQQIGDCINSLQSVQGLEIDAFNRLWIIDSGRVATFSKNPQNSQNLCPPKLIVMDLNTNQMIRRFEFPSGVVSPETNLLNEINLQCKSAFDCKAYISDGNDGKIIIFDYSSGISWFVTHPSMKSQESSIRVGQIPTLFLAASPNVIFYSPAGSPELFAIPQSVLPEETDSSEISDCDVYKMGLFYGESRALSMDSRGFLFYGIEGGIKFWNSSISSTFGGSIVQPEYFLGLNGLEENNQFLVHSNKNDLRDIESFTFDDRGGLYALSVDPRILDPTNNSGGSSSRLQSTGISMRILRVFVGSKSYVHLPNVIGPING